MWPRNTGMNGDTTGTDVNGLAHLSDLIKANTTVAAVQDIAGIGVNFEANCLSCPCILYNV